MAAVQGRDGTWRGRAGARCRSESRRRRGAGGCGHGRPAALAAGLLTQMPSERSIDRHSAQQRVGYPDRGIRFSLLYTSKDAERWDYAAAGALCDTLVLMCHRA
eukprot:COSAG01_NODE_7324_length_3256_cov_1.496510_3_plen_104_part_00